MLALMTGLQKTDDNEIIDGDVGRSRAYVQDAIVMNSLGRLCVVERSETTDTWLLVELRLKTTFVY